MVADNPREHLAFLIHDVAKRLRLEFGRRAARFDLTPAQARCLVFLGVRPGASTGSFTVLPDRQELTPSPYAIGLSLPYSASYNASSAIATS